MNHAAIAHRTAARSAPRRLSAGPGWRLVAGAVLGLAAVTTVLPFVWELVLATHNTGDIAGATPPFSVGRDLVRNYQALMEYAPYFWRSMLNSGIIALGSTVTTLFFSALGGYAFARYDFPGKERLFWLLLLTMMIPGQLGLIPWYVR